MRAFAYNARLVTTDDVLAHRVDRVDELRRLRLALLKKNGNVYLYGPRGVGKTFLLRILAHDMCEATDDVFAFFFPLDMQLAMLGSRHPDASAFPVAFSLQLVSAAWASLVRGKYRDLAKAADWEARRLAIEHELYDTLVDFRRRLATSKTDTEHERGSAVGASAVLKGEIKERSSMQRQTVSLIPSEIHNHIRELTDVMSSECGIKRVIVLCDEANLLPEEWQTHIVANHLQIFGDLGIQFVFVAGFLPEIEDATVPDIFDEAIELRGLTLEATGELLDKAFGSEGYYFAADALGELHAYTAGNPRRLLGVAWDAVDLLDSKSDRFISLSVMSRAIEDAEEKYQALLRSHPANKAIDSDKK